MERRALSCWPLLEPHLLRLQGGRRGGVSGTCSGRNALRLRRHLSPLSVDQRWDCEANCNRQDDAARLIFEAGAQAHVVTTASSFDEHKAILSSLTVT